jgi:hypothetical protein
LVRIFATFILMLLVPVRVALFGSFGPATIAANL